MLVVGGGLAGLAAALRLEAAGIEVLLCEASARLGGRLASESLEGFRFDPFPHALPAQASNLSLLIEQAGLVHEIRIEPLRRVAVARRGRLRHLDLERVARLGLAPGVPPWQALRMRGLRRLIDWFGERLDPHAPEDATRLDDRSVADFVRLYLGPRVLERLLEPLFTAHFGLQAEWTSRVLLLLAIGPSGELRLSTGFGLGRLPERLAEPLRSVRLETRVEGVREDGRGARLASGEELDAAAVVLAVPAPEALRLIPNPSPFEELFLQRVSYPSRVGLAVVVEPATELPAPVVWIPAAEGGLLGAVAEPSSAASGRSLLLLLARPELERVHGGDDRGAVESLLRGAETLWPGLRERIRARRLQRTRVASFDVGHFRGIARLREGLEKARDRRRVFFAGDYLVGPHLEGAATSGFRAADDVLRALD